jgi:hypothetical protein
MATEQDLYVSSVFDTTFTTESVSAFIGPTGELSSPAVMEDNTLLQPKKASKKKKSKLPSRLNLH